MVWKSLLVIYNNRNPEGVGKRWVTPCDTPENPEKNPENSEMFGIFLTVLEAEQVHLLQV